MKKSLFKETILMATLVAATCTQSYAQPVGTSTPATASQPHGGSVLAFSGVEAKPGNILSIMVPTTSLLGGAELAVHVTGTGKICQYHLVVINTDTAKESYFPQTSKFPALVHANLPLNQFPHGNYKVAAMAWGGDKASGIACLSGGEYTPFKIERPKINLGADWPKITDITLTPGISSAPNTYRINESIGYSVLGSVDNIAGSADKRCGWTVFLEGNGQSVRLGNGTSFGVPMSASLAAFKPGNYTLKAHTSPGDYNLIAVAKMSCLGSATKPITIVALPGQIEGLKLTNQPQVGPAINEKGILVIEPIIAGPKCYYHITQLINGGAAPQFSGTRVHVPGVSDEQPFQIYSADQTNVQITIDVGDVEKASGTPCDGSITKSITVLDAGKLNTK